MSLDNIGLRPSPLHGASRRILSNECTLYGGGPVNGKPTNKQKTYDTMCLI